jgi:hypothetical protein
MFSGTRRPQNDVAFGTRKLIVHEMARLPFGIAGLLRLIAAVGPEMVKAASVTFPTG